MQSEQGTMLQSLCVVKGFLDEHAGNGALVTLRIKSRRPCQRRATRQSKMMLTPPANAAYLPAMPPRETFLSRRAFTQLLGAAAIGPMLPAESLLAANIPMPTPAAPDEITSLSAVDLAARIRRKELSAREVLEAHLTRIDRVNPRVNAIVTLVPDKARAWAKAADEKQASGAALGPLHGLPVAHKDLVDDRGDPHDPRLALL